MSEEEVKEVKEVKPEKKKETSYTYWVDEKNKGKQLPEEHKPKKIDPPPQQSNAGNSGPSMWNTSGTWEQRSISMKELNSKIESIFKDWFAESKSELVLLSVELEGELKQIFANNKRKVLFEITGVIKFEGDSLQLKLEEISCSGDREYKVKGKKAEEKARLQNISGKLIEMMVEQFNRYKQ